jgi:hypothetical protein
MATINVGGWVLNRYVSILFNPVVFPFPCTPLLFVLLAFMFSICLGK